MTNNIHSGHRQRLKDKIRKFGLETLNEHEVLEWLLTYTIPYKDTNVLAHALIGEFGDIGAVVNASINELMSVRGVGAETALFLSRLPDLFEMCKKNKPEDDIRLCTPRDIVDYFRKYYHVTRVEVMYVVCLDANNKLVRMIDFGQNNPVSVQVDVCSILKNILPTNTKSIVIMHTHPNGDPTPSREDTITTKKLMYLCYLLGIKFNDHIIMADDKFYSYGMHDLHKMREEVCLTLGEVYYQRASHFDQRLPSYDIARIRGSDAPDKKDN